MTYKILGSVICLLFHCTFTAQACTGDTRCEHRKYGHRRAFLSDPILIVEEELYCYRRGFKSLEREALKLREHLIRTHAFSSQESFEWRDMFAKSLGKTSTIEGDVREALKVYPDRKEDRVRKGLIAFRDEINSQQHNIASFGIIFFDQNGRDINRDPFYFSPDAQEDTLTNPFFFLSGHRQRDPRADDRFPWTALPRSTPQESDLDLIPKEETLSDRRPVVEKAFKEAIPNFPWADLELSRKTFEAAYSGYKTFLTSALIAKAREENFFGYVYERWSAFNQKGEKPVCPSLLETIKPSVADLKVRDSECWHYPKKIDGEEKDGEEKDGRQKSEGHFRHSEQYALFRADAKFEDFMDKCIKRLKSLIGDTGTAMGSSPKTVESYVVLIYTYNSMCVRCAQSTIIDFVYKDKSLNSIINRKLDELEETPTSRMRPMTFLAGYTYPYGDREAKYESDDFEKEMLRDGGLPQVDITCGEDGFGYTECSPEEDPQMIYHVRIP